MFYYYCVELKTRTVIEDFSFRVFNTIEELNEFFSDYHGHYWDEITVTMEVRVWDNIDSRLSIPMAKIDAIQDRPSNYRF